MVECAPGFVPFTRASSAGLAGKRVAACLRGAAPSSATPRRPEQRSEPEGPRSRVPGGIAKGGRASGPLWLARRKGERLNQPQLNKEVIPPLTRDESKKGQPVSRLAFWLACRDQSWRRVISTRRFCARPASVSLLAIGWLGPTPALLIRAPLTPWPAI